MKTYSKILVFSLFLFSLKAQAQSIPDFSDKLNKSIYDYAALLSVSDYENIHDRIEKFKDSTSIGIVVVTVGSIRGHISEEYAMELADKWGIHQPQNTNTILLLFVERERIFEMVAGSSIQKKFPEVTERKIQSLHVEENFRDNRYSEGIHEVVSVVMGISTGTLSNAEAYKKASNRIYFVIIPLFLFFLFIFPFIQYRTIKNSTIGSKPISILTSFSLTNAFGGLGRSVYADFEKGEGKFKGYNSGGGGAAGFW